VHDSAQRVALVGLEEVALPVLAMVSAAKEAATRGVDGRVCQLEASPQHPLHIVDQGFAIGVCLRPVRESLRHVLVDDAGCIR
jgi:hypothetical protein